MNNSEKIAVIGMNCRYPGANNIEQFWENLLEGKETIHRFSDEELQDFEPNYSELKKHPNYVPARGILDDVEMFDADFFGFNPYEAKTTDPQHRVWLETVWNAFENAGIDPFSYKGSIGVFAGGYVNTYLLNNILRDKEKYENFIRLRTTESFQIMTASDIAYLPTKTSYAFNLRGPAINVQTACSTSLVAIAQACNSLYSYESDVCIAGGVAILNPQQSGYIHQEGAIPSPDGHCRPFDANGQGTVFSNGVGVVILKRLDDAIKDGDNIISVVRGWALNNDGNQKVGFTAPSVEGQARVITSAQNMAKVSPDDLRYIEAHGTATILGDPIEISGLKMAFDRGTSQKQFCGIGSVKSNIGHTDAAAGVAAFLKLSLIAQNRVIPPSINYEAPNPYINFAQTPFRVIDQKEAYTSDDPLIMGVSSFGIGGTNAHIIVEEYRSDQNETNTILKNSSPLLIPISAKSEEALKNRKKQFIVYVKKQKDNLILNDIAHTLWNGRSHMNYRASIAVSSIDELLQDDIIFNEGEVSDTSNSVTFMFSGQGAQFYQMGKVFYEEHTVFKNLVDKGIAIVKTETGKDIKQLMFDCANEENAEFELAKTFYTQTSLYILQYSCARVLLQQGISPKYLIGHSIGEFAAAALAGVFDFETGMKIVIKRGQLMEAMEEGEMFAVFAPRKEIEAFGNNLFEIAAQNTIDSCTISFETKELEQVKYLFDEKGIRYLHLSTSHAFHSKAFDPILEEFATFVNCFDLCSPKLKVISCLSGNFLTKEQATDGDYWASQLRNTVQFYRGIQTITSESKSIFIEVGPNAHLSSMLGRMTELFSSRKWILTLGRPENKDRKHVLENIVGALWCYQQTFEPMEELMPENGKKISLPVYPFNRKRHWIDFKLENDKQHTLGEKNEAVREEEFGIEEELLKIWKESLSIEEINTDDNFFDIGGDSLMAVSVVSKIKTKFDIDFGLRSFFDAPRIMEQAEIVEINMSEPFESTDKLKIDRSVYVISGEI